MIRAHGGQVSAPATCPGWYPKYPWLLGTRRQARVSGQFSHKMRTYSRLMGGRRDYKRLWPGRAVVNGSLQALKRGRLSHIIKVALKSN